MIDSCGDPISGLFEVQITICEIKSQMAQVPRSLFLHRLRRTTTILNCLRLLQMRH